ncbi:hypothetical protein ACFVAJ_19330 [Agromyces sp. NPDC057679]|uniref:hypothetical protein n=1 Tax=Agromyces sp. NPDC057679 TaxID=3346207 RepID=UPI00366C0A65
MSERTHDNLELTERDLDLRFLIPSIVMAVASFVSTIILFGGFANSSPVAGWIGFVVFLLAGLAFGGVIVYNALQLRAIDQVRTTELSDYMFERHGLELTDDVAREFLKEKKIATRHGMIRLVRHVEGGWAVATGAGKILTSGVDLAGVPATR